MASQVMQARGDLPQVLELLDEEMGVHTPTPQSFAQPSPVLLLQHIHLQARIPAVSFYLMGLSWASAEASVLLGNGAIAGCRAEQSDHVSRVSHLQEMKNL